MNLHGENDRYQDSDTHVRYDAGNVQTVDPHGLMESATVTIQAYGGDKQVVTFHITFEGAMEQTNMVARLWNADLSLLTVQVLDAFEVVTEIVVDPEPTEPGVDPEPTVPGVDPEPVLKLESVVDPEPTLDEAAAIRMWSGFDSVVLDDAGLLEALGLDYPGADIPSWMMTELGPLVAKEKITMDEFIAALEYVLLEGA